PVKNTKAQAVEQLVCGSNEPEGKRPVTAVRVLETSTGYPDLLMSVHELQQNPDRPWPHFGVGVEQKNEAGRIGRSERGRDCHIVTRTEPSVAGSDLEGNPTLPAMGSDRLGQSGAVARGVVDHGDADP